MVIVMKSIRKIELVAGSNEELLPDFAADFPYIATCAELSHAVDPVVPWHWHPAAELFFIASGTLEYSTPNGRWQFPAGSGGFVNANVLHTSKVDDDCEHAVQHLHLFAPEFLASDHGSRLKARYVLPLTTSDVEVIPVYPDSPENVQLLAEIQQAFEVSEDTWGYEFELRHQLERIWLKLVERARPRIAGGTKAHGTDEKVKAMMAYIHQHFSEPISVDMLAGNVHISKRVCFRLFQEQLHMTPVEYMRSYRLRKACQLLTGSNESITHIAYACGLGASSYFGKVFREHYGCSPAEYRKNGTIVI